MFCFVIKAFGNENKKVQFFLKKGIDIYHQHGYNNTRSLNSEVAWCNGNTWVSKTFVEGSSPSAPANGAFPEKERLFFFTGHRGRNGCRRCKHVDLRAVFWYNFDKVFVEGDMLWN